MSEFPTCNRSMLSTDGTVIRKRAVLRTFRTVVTPDQRAAIEIRMQAFNQDLLREDELGMVLRAHLHIERELVLFIKARLAPASVFDTLELDYDHTIKLAIALGLDPIYRPALRFVGTLRNRFAHQLGITILTDDARNFHQALDPYARQVAADRYRETNEKLRRPGRPGDIGALAPSERIILYFVTLWSAIAVANVNTAHIG